MAKMNKFLNRIFCIRVLIYFLAFIAGWPCVFYLMGWLPNYKVNYLILFGLVAIFVLVKQELSLPKQLGNMIIIQIIGWILFSFIHHDSTYFTRIFYLIIMSLLLMMEYHDTIQNRFSNVFIGWISLQCILGTIGVLLVVFGLLQPLFIFEEMDLRNGYCFGLFTTNAYYDNFARNAGFFDEPGALACWGVYALLLNKLMYNNKKIELLLIIGLISTLSIAFYIQLSVYLLLFYHKDKLRLFILLVIACGAILYLSSINDSISGAIFGRLEFDDETGTIAGDNRSELFGATWKLFLQRPIFGWGAKELAMPYIYAQYGFVGANFFYNWAADGVFGLIITYIPLIYVFILGKRDFRYTYIALIILIGYLQRPYDSTQLLYPLMTYTLILHMMLNINKDVPSKNLYTL